MGNTCAHSFPGFPAAVERVRDSSGLFDFEKLQLTDDVLTNLANYDLEVLPAISFPTSQQAEEKSHRKGVGVKCKTYPNDREWPSDATWRLFNALLGDRLIKSVPEAAICYPEWGNYSASGCQSLTGSWNNSTLRYAPLIQTEAISQGASATYTV